MFVIANGLTGNLYHKPGHYSYATYETLQGAKSAATRLQKTEGTRWYGYVAMEYNYWDRLFNPEVEVQSLMNGATVKIRKSEVGTCSDPSTERYWTM
jgi:hypothetical protein